jgi:hypothetical protein
VGDDDNPTAPGPAAPSIEPYEPPRIDLLGAVDKLTRGPDPGVGDLDGGVISF